MFEKAAAFPWATNKWASPFLKMSKKSHKGQEQEAEPLDDDEDEQLFEQGYPWGLGTFTTRQITRQMSSVVEAMARQMSRQITTRQMMAAAKQQQEQAAKSEQDQDFLEGAGALVYPFGLGTWDTEEEGSGDAGGVGQEQPPNTNPLLFPSAYGAEDKRSVGKGGGVGGEGYHHRLSALARARELLESGLAKSGEHTLAVLSAQGLALAECSPASASQRRQFESQCPWGLGTWKDWEEQENVTVTVADGQQQEKDAASKSTTSRTKADDDGVMELCPLAVSSSNSYPFGLGTWDTWTRDEEEEVDDNERRDVQAGVIVEKLPREKVGSWDDVASQAETTVPLSEADTSEYYPADDLESGAASWMEDPVSPEGARTPLPPSASCPASMAALALPLQKKLLHGTAAMTPKERMAAQTAASLKCSSSMGDLSGAVTPPHFPGAYPEQLMGA